jgi:hypothetical protein
MGHNQIFMVETCHKRGNYSKPNGNSRVHDFRQTQGNKAFPVPNRKRPHRSGGPASSCTPGTGDPEE